jgi:Beta-ketoacyl synthase, N-terminal domain
LIYRRWTVEFEFVVLDWAAYADSMTSRQDWLAWAKQAPILPGKTVSEPPGLNEMPAMMRRRVDRLGRLACQVAYWCQPHANASSLVFASRYGEATRSLALLGDLVNQQPLSPTGFALSVHNAVSALYSIARHDQQQAVVVAASQDTAHAALAEAAGLLADGATDVLLVFYEAPLPDTYAVFETEPACEYAWCLRMAKQTTTDSLASKPPRIKLPPCSDTHQPNTDRPPTLPQGLSVLHQILQQMVQSEAQHEPA